MPKHLTKVISPITPTALHVLFIPATPSERSLPTGKTHTHTHYNGKIAHYNSHHYTNYKGDIGGHTGGHKGDTAVLNCHVHRRILPVSIGTLKIGLDFVALRPCSGATETLIP